MELDEHKGHASVLKDRTEPQVLRELVDLLLERKNRVLARLFLHNVSGCQDIKPKVREWAQQLNNAGKNSIRTACYIAKAGCEWLTSKCFCRSFTYVKKKKHLCLTSVHAFM